MENLKLDADADPPFGGSEYHSTMGSSSVISGFDPLLEDTHKGYFVPGRPDKNVLESQVMHGREFVRLRQLELDKYLRHLALHPVIRKSEELKLFLTTDGKLPFSSKPDIKTRVLDSASKLPRQLLGTAPDYSTTSANGPVHAAAGGAGGGGGGKDFFQMFRELKQTVANEWTGRPPVAEDDVGFLKQKERLEVLERNLRLASEKAEKLVRGQEELGLAMALLGTSFKGLAKFEQEHSSMDVQRTLAASTDKAASSIISVSRVLRQETHCTLQNLERLHDYLKLMGSVHTAFSARAQSLLTLQTLETEVGTKKEKLSKQMLAQGRVLGGEHERTRKIEELKREIEGLDGDKQTAELEYEKVKERNREEWQRMEEEKERDICGMLQNLVFTELRCAERSAQEWAGLVVHLRQQKQQVGSSSGSGKRTAY
eukprot:TRINITY_DN3428_c0_g2_i1.p1 TRINITY_DN3428_c0_g2~~TRINITY_DN3428_c0_g2_i1.p1  ORF type:complete len:458 (-),score=152.45 TRINITY_DN3428_c0_g2_i1:139-1422(-)